MEELRNTLEAILRELFQSVPEVGTHPVQWVRLTRTDPGMSMDPEPRIDWSDVARQYLDNGQYPSLERLVSAIRDDPALASQILIHKTGEPVGEDPQLQQSAVRKRLLTPFLTAYLVAGMGDLRPDSERFNRVFQQLAADLQAPTIIVRRVTPLLNARMAVDEIVLGPGLRLRKLALSEIEAWYNNGLMQGLYGIIPLSSHHLVELDCAVEFTYEAPKSGRDWGQYQESIDLTDRAIRTVRLLTGHAVALAFSQELSENLLWDGSSGIYFGPPIPRYRTNGTDITEEDGNRLVHLWERLQNSPNRNKVELAISRWDSAIDRQTNGDKLLDYWIGLESLFIPDGSAELTYRAALRIAAFLNPPTIGRASIYKHIRDSYDCRSAVVHGKVAHGNRKDKILKRTDELTEKTRSYFQQALLQILDSDKPFDATDIESMILNSYQPGSHEDKQE